jgi:hypothetical protein
MKQDFAIEHQFVEFIPNEREERKLYVSIEYATAAHNCFCGCGTKVVTPISPTGWRLMFDGETVSLDPSVGNWGFKCRSHYWVRRNKVVCRKVPGPRREGRIFWYTEVRGTGKESTSKKTRDLGLVVTSPLGHPRFVQCGFPSGRASRITA